MLINARKIEVILANKNMNFLDLRKKAKIAGTSITKLKNGEDLRLKTVSKIIKALNISAEDII